MYLGTERDIQAFIIILLTGTNTVLLLQIGGIMNDFNAALARLQASSNKAIAKIDTLNAGNDAALTQAAAQLNAISDSLDAKSV